MSPKIDAARRNFQSMRATLLCPHCRAELQQQDNCFRCPAGHCYDLSARNYLNLAPAQRQTGQKYNKDLFAARRRVFEGGFYQPLLDEIAAVCLRLHNHPRPDMLDAGCGEGWFAGTLYRQLTADGREPELLAVDLSKDGVEMAAAHTRPLKCLIADLARLPLPDASLDIILNILSPANYSEFRRVLRPDGLLLKVIPGEDYLCQVRRSLGIAPGHTSDAANIFDAAAAATTQTRMRYTLPVTPAQAADFLRMSPLSFGHTGAIPTTPDFTEVTIDLILLTARFGD